MKGNIIRIQEGGKLTDIILSLVSLAVSIPGSIAAYLYFSKGKMLVNDETWLMILVALCPIGLFMSLNFAVVYTLEINLKKKKYRKSWKLGPYCFASWRNLPEAEYISVFRQVYRDDDGDGESATTYTYDINLWYDTSKYITLTQHHNRKTALKMGTAIAGGMGIGLLDATIPNSNKWLKE